MCTETEQAIVAIEAGPKAEDTPAPHAPQEPHRPYQPIDLEPGQRYVSA